jgi:hypothetical protein
MMTPRQAEVQGMLDAGLAKREIARRLGVNIKTVYDILERAAPKVSPVVKLEEVGYQTDRPERTPADAWNAHSDAFERAISDSLKCQWRPIHRPKGPFVIFHATDEHLDADACPLRLIEADVAAAHNLNAIMVHGGDLLNNWPMGGKLAKQWADQSCTKADALLRAQHFISIFKPDVWTDGNHEEMNEYLVALFKEWLPAKTLTDYWAVNFEVITPGGRPIRVKASHKFEKGSSWFHPHHGVIRELLEAEAADLYVEGHHHVAGVMYRVLPERRIAATAVASAGYKLLDKWATRISKGGKIPKIKGRAHWIVGDPYADEDQTACVAFDCPRQAEAYFNGLQNLRAA